MPDSLKGRGETKRNPAPWGEPGLSAVLPSVRNHRAIKKLLSSLSPLYSTLPTSSSGYSLLLSILTEPISCLYSTKLSQPLHFPPLFSTFFFSLELSPLFFPFTTLLLHALISLWSTSDPARLPCAATRDGGERDPGG